MKSMQRKTAIIVGGGGYNDMGLIRSCGEAGMKVICVTQENTVIPIYKSKYVYKRIVADIIDKDTLRKIVGSVSAENPDSKTVLFPASDAAACIIDELWNEFEGIAITPNASGHIRQLMDKAYMADMADKCGLAVPHFMKADLRIDSMPSFTIPCIVKPPKSIAGEKADITVCRSEEAYKSTLIKYHSKGYDDILIQELVEGENLEEVAITGVSLPSGKVETYGMIHKIRTRGNGSTVFGNYLPECDSELRQHVIRFIKTTGYQGIFDIEFLHNESGYHFIECNFRNGAYGYAVTSAGFNMPSVFSDDKPLSSQKELKQIQFMEERSDFLNVLDKSINIWRWLKDVVTTDTFLWWNRRDPMPMLRHYLKKFGLK